MKKIPAFLILILCGHLATAQKGYRPINLGTFDTKLYHFGFLLGFNSASSAIEFNPEALTKDSLLSVNSTNQPGFNLGIVAAYHFTPNLTVRFIPSLSFQDRLFTYSFAQQNDKPVVYDKRIQSTYVDFPINFKFRTSRLNNIAPYGIIGAKYSIDMQTNKDVKNAVAEEIVLKIDNNDYSFELGGGLDFFLPYFKFGLELKMAIGIPNLIIQDDTQFSRPIESLRTRTFMVTFTFEG